MGESMIISSSAAPVAPSFLVPYGPALQQRPRPTFRGAVAAAGGALVGIGVGAIAGNLLRDDPRVAAAVIAALFLAMGYAVLVAAPQRFAPAGLVLVAPAPALLAGALTISSDSSSATPTLFVATVLWAACWLVPVTRRSLVFGLALAGLWLTLVALAVDTNVLSDGPTQVFQNNEAWSLSLVVGVAYLVLGLMFDRKGWAGFSTPFFAIGDYAFVIGVSGTVSRIDGVGGPLLVVLASLMLTFVGDAGGRRLTTWLGGGGVVIGCLALTAQLLDTDEVVPNALLILVLGVALLTLVFRMSTARVSNDLAATSAAEAEAATEHIPSSEH